MARRSAAVNARLEPAVAYGGDPYGEARQRALAGEIASRLQGHGSAAYAGDRGDPGRSFTGYALPPQRFTGAAFLAANPHTYRDVGTNTLESGLPGAGVYTDPVRRILAEQLRRRTA